MMDMTAVRIKMTNWHKIRYANS